MSCCWLPDWARDRVVVVVQQLVLVVLQCWTLVFFLWWDALCTPLFKNIFWGALGVIFYFYLSFFFSRCCCCCSSGSRFFFFLLFSFFPFFLCVLLSDRYIDTWLPPSNLFSLPQVPRKNFSFLLPISTLSLCLRWTKKEK